MKPFNLDEALAGKPVVTRDGRPVKIAGVIITGDNEVILYSNKRILGLTGTIGNGCVVYNTIQSWDENGRIYTNKDSDNDLFMVPLDQKEWVVRYNVEGERAFTAGPFSTLLGAELFIKTVGEEYKCSIHEITIIE